MSISKRASAAKWSVALSAMILLPASSGCLLSMSHSRVVRQSEPVKAVHFESEYAQKSFQHMAFNDHQRKKQSGKTSVGIPFLLGASYETVLSENAYYNDWVARVDANRDGVISDSEIEAVEGTPRPIEEELPSMPMSAPTPAPVIEAVGHQPR